MSEQEPPVVAGVKIEIKHRFTGAVLYTTEVPAEDRYPVRTALVRATAARANLADADLAGAYLARANLADANLADANLADAYLADAYLADANLADANLARANLADADLAGAYLARANLADANLADANLADAYLADAYLADANLADANLARANLADADLAGAYLARANLADANLAGANLADANLADARNLPAGAPAADPSVPYDRKPLAVSRHERAERYRARHPEVPVVDRLDTQILELVTSGKGQLEMGSWHTCGTTHCRGGWAITLAGPAGAALERERGVEQASAMIYRASTGRVPYFFGDNESALEDIKRCAAIEAEQATPTEVTP